MLEDYSDRYHQLITFEIYERSARHINKQKRAIRFSVVLSSGRSDHRQKTAATEASVASSLSIPYLHVMEAACKTSIYKVLMSTTTEKVYWSTGGRYNFRTCVVVASNYSRPEDESTLVRSLKSTNQREVNFAVL